MVCHSYDTHSSRDRNRNICLSLWKNDFRFIWEIIDVGRGYLRWWGMQAKQAAAQHKLRFPWLLQRDPYKHSVGAGLTLLSRRNPLHAPPRPRRAANFPAHTQNIPPLTPWLANVYLTVLFIFKRECFHINCDRVTRIQSQTDVIWFYFPLICTYYVA